MITILMIILGVSLILFGVFNLIVAILLDKSENKMTGGSKYTKLHKQFYDDFYDTEKHIKYNKVVMKKVSFNTFKGLYNLNPNRFIFDVKNVFVVRDYKVGSQRLDLLDYCVACFEFNLIDRIKYALFILNNRTINKNYIPAMEELVELFNKDENKIKTNTTNQTGLTKQDLIGNIVENTNGHLFYIVQNGTMYDKTWNYMDFEEYGDDFCSPYEEDDYDIIKVYNARKYKYANPFDNIKNMEIIWERGKI